MSISRRRIVQALALAPFLLASCSSADSPDTPKVGQSLPVNPLLKRTIPSSGELVPVVGLGTYQVITALNEPKTRSRLSQVLREFHRRGGSFIDTSPMYGPAEESLGELLKTVNEATPEDWFLATKVWTDGRESGLRQMESSVRKMGVKTLDLMQIHNLRDWKTHLPILKQWKEEGKIRYLGITTWGGHDHPQFESLMRDEALDFVQFTYNIVDREAEERLLPLAKERGIATVINRPFSQGALLKRLSGQNLPNWVKVELACQTWAQVLLKFILADERVTVVIPATSKPHHLVDNMGAGLDPMPDEAQRERLFSLVREAV